VEEYVKAILPLTLEEPPIPDFDWIEVGRMNQVQFWNILQLSSTYDNE
jgi:hypothetical protein